MLAICSDLDETPDKHVYFEIIKYLNTTKETSIGPGVGLETGNTIYFDMQAGQFSYWNTDDEGRAKTQALIKSGHIDCLHSFGDHATTRAHAEKALNELSRQNCKLEVWVDHATAPTNFGPDIMQGQGDVIGSEAYHADLSTGFGIKFVWRGRVTSVIGQNVPRRLRGIWKPQKPLASARTLMKEYIKGMSAATGNKKYAIHAPNEILKDITLRSGHRVLEFIRSNMHWGGVSFGDNPGGIPEAIRTEVLDRLVEREGLSIVYTHLGKIKGNPDIFPASTRAAFIHLSEYYRDGKILVTTTSRLLRYSRMLREINVSITGNDTYYAVNIETAIETQELEGLTIYIPNDKMIKIHLNGIEINNYTVNPPDFENRYSISFPWKKLVSPDI